MEVFVLLFLKTCMHAVFTIVLRYKFSLVISRLIMCGREAYRPFIKAIAVQPRFLE